MWIHIKIKGGINSSFCPKSYHELNLLMFRYRKYNNILKSQEKKLAYPIILL